jgi:hypothetical protein
MGRCHHSPWRDTESTVKYIYLEEDNILTQPIEQEMQGMNYIMDAKYSKANL